MKLSERQLSAYVRYVTILRNIQKRCIVQGIDIHADAPAPGQQPKRKYVKKHSPPSP